VPSRVASLVVVQIVGLLLPAVAALSIAVIMAIEVRRFEREAKRTRHS
jgi:hypothetical protein